MISRIVEKYVAPAVAAAAPAVAGGAGGGGGGAGVIGTAGASAAGGGGGGGLGKAAEIASALPVGGGSEGKEKGKGGGDDLATKGIRTAGSAAAGGINLLSTIPESAGSRYQADLARLRAQRYAGPTQSNVNTGHPSDDHRFGLRLIETLKGHLNELSNQNVEIRNGDRADFDRNAVALAGQAYQDFHENSHRLTDEHWSEANALANKLDRGYGGLTRFDDDGKRIMGTTPGGGGWG
jgi:hypothetical protein